MILRLAKTEPDWRAQRLASAKYVRCPMLCDPKTGCAHCLFWGSVLKDSPDAACIHDYGCPERVSPRLWNHRCRKCGVVHAIDSSG